VKEKLPVALQPVREVGPSAALGRLLCKRRRAFSPHALYHKGCREHSDVALQLRLFQDAPAPCGSCMNIDIIFAAKPCLTEQICALRFQAGQKGHTCAAQPVNVAF
jgi:hypothetical protein